jgi:predicted ATPase
LVAGRFPSARSHLEEALAIYDPVCHRLLVQQAEIHPHVNSQALLGIALFCLGYPEQALAQSNAAVAEARTRAHPPSLAASLAISARLVALNGQDVALSERADELIAVATEQGFPLYRALGIIYRGWGKVKNGDVMDGMSLLSSGMAAYRATGSELMIPYWCALLARACGIAGQTEEAVTLLNDAAQIAERTGERFFAAELSRHKGQLLLRQGHAQRAEKLYRKALDIAQEQEAKLWELRAAISMARLWGEQGRRAEASDLLAAVYGWFTEGFDTADLREAKELLDALR